MNYAILSLSFTLLGTLIVTVWKMATMLTILQETNKQNRLEFDELKKELVNLRTIPFLAIQVGQLQEVVAKHTSMFPKFTNVHESQLRSLRALRKVEVPK